MKETRPGIPLQPESGNFFEGYRSGYSNTSGSQNYFSGQQAGYNNTANQNHFVGYQAGFNNTTGTKNHFEGFGAGSYNTSRIAIIILLATRQATVIIAANDNHFSGYQAGY